MLKYQKLLLILFAIIMTLVYSYLIYIGVSYYQEQKEVEPLDTIEQELTYLGKHVVTFYCSNVCMPNKPCLTATSVTPTPGRTVAVDPKQIPLGSKIHVEGFGYLIAEDTGGAIKGKKLDIYTATCAEARKLAVKVLEVHLVKDLN